MRILHAFVGSCVESEVLNDYGNVYGFGIEPTVYSQQNVTEYIQCDLRNGLPTRIDFDFGLLQPPCKRFSLAGGSTDHPNLIPTAREIAETHCEYWVIENVRNSPIGFDPDLRLKGDMFGLGVKYERVFWSNYDIPQPEITSQNAYQYSMQSMRKHEAMQQKGYENRYYAHDVIQNGLPKPYVKHLLEHCPVFS